MHKTCMKMKMKMINHLCGQHQGRNLLKRSVTQILMTKISYLRFLQDRRQLLQCEEEIGPPVWQDPAATLEQEVSRDSRERAEDLDKKTDGEALRDVVNQLSDEGNLRDLHLKHYHTSTAQFKKRTTHLDIPGKLNDLHQHVVKTCPF